MIQSRVKTKTSYMNINAVDVEELLLRKLRFRRQYKNRKIYLYCEEFAVLDTETSHLDEESAWIYQWAVCFNKDFIYGRKPSEFIRLLEKLRDYYSLNDMKKIIFYIHNASYDMQYLKHYLKAYDSNIEIFAIDNHSMLAVDVFGFRFLCSYKLSNMNLDLFSNTYAENFVKASGAIDYNIVRYQDSKLSENDWYYMFSDVASLHDAITNYLITNGYNYAFQAPITSTGFVRTDCRKSSEKEGKYRKWFLKMALKLDQYLLTNKAFMGGLTVANFLYAGTTLTDDKHKIRHADFKSSYPARIMIDYFPIGKPTWYGDIDDREEFDFLLDHYCCIFVLTMDNVHIKEGVTLPYIPSSKCIYKENELKLNGKIVYADTLSIAITEVDYKIIKKQYTGENIQISDMLIFKRGKAPEWLRSKTMQYFNNKCTLKGVDDKLYACSKALLNAIYGMTATAICRDTYELDEDLILGVKHGDKEKQISKFYNSRNSFMPYQFGVYTTAHARSALIDMVEAVGYENFLYCDTDSVFYIATPEAEKNLQKLNRKLKARAKKAGAYIGDDYLGVADFEPDLHKFRALHAKCYAMEEYNKEGVPELKVTIAGIPKKTTKWINGEKVTISNAEELKSIDNLKDGFIFKHNGGTRSVYIEDLPRIKNISGHKTELASSCIILNIEKEINNTMWSYTKDFIPIKLKMEK